MKQITIILVSIVLLFMLACSEGITPLMKASKEGDIAEANKLIRKGANVNATDRYGDSSLYWAIRGDYPEIVKLLIVNGANVNTPFQRGYTPIITASFYGNSEVVDYLLKSGADPNTVNEDGQCALSTAAFNNDEIIVNSLLKYNADPNTCNPLYFASSKGNIKIVEILISNGASINNKENIEDSALLAAVMTCQFETLKILLENGANTNLRNSKGETPLDLAQRVTKSIMLENSNNDKVSSCNSISVGDCEKTVSILVGYKY